ncbi:MAG: hypothetical protein ACRDWH_08395 [Acidimicrobiia bacterium]
MRLHIGTLFAGLVFTAIGVTFSMEALGWWKLQLSDFRLVGPIALVVAGLAVIVGSIGRSRMA